MPTRNSEERRHSVAFACEPLRRAVAFTSHPTTDPACFPIRAPTDPPTPKEGSANTIVRTYEREREITYAVLRFVSTPIDTEKGEGEFFSRLPRARDNSYGGRRRRAVIEGNWRDAERYPLASAR